MKIRFDRMLVAASFMTFAMGSVAHAELLCFGSAQNPDDGESWGTYCESEGNAYADVEVTPEDEESGSISVHVTDHFGCYEGTHLECGFGTSWEGSVECLGEDELTIPYTGYLPAVTVFCGCYQPGQSCLGE